MSYQRHSPPSQADETPTDGPGTSTLRAQFRITPHEDAGCSVLATTTHADAVSQNVICTDGTCESECTCRATVSDSSTGESAFVSGTVGNHCICPIFSEHDCVVSFDGIENGALVITVTTTGREQLSGLVTALRETGASVSLQRLSHGSDAAATSSRLLELETGSITTKQREAVELAVEEGYYESPRQTDLAELAATLEISRSAVSQRLRAVESKLIQHLADG